MTCTVDEIHLNDVGTILRVTMDDVQSDGSTTTLDISSATTLQIILKKPSGSKLTKTGVFFTDGTDGILQYTTISGDINEFGEWKIQAYIEMPSGNWYSSVDKFTVLENL